MRLDARCRPARRSAFWAAANWAACWRLRPRDLASNATFSRPKPITRPIRWPRRTRSRRYDDEAALARFAGRSASSPMNSRMCRRQPRLSSIDLVPLAPNSKSARNLAGPVSPKRRFSPNFRWRLRPSRGSIVRPISRRRSPRPAAPQCSRRAASAMTARARLWFAAGDDPEAAFAAIGKAAGDPRGLRRISSARFRSSRRAAGRARSPSMTFPRTSMRITFCAVRSCRPRSVAATAAAARDIAAQNRCSARLCGCDRG